MWEGLVSIGPRPPHHAVEPPNAVLEASHPVGKGHHPLQGYVCIEETQILFLESANYRPTPKALNQTSNRVLTTNYAYCD